MSESKLQHQRPSWSERDTFVPRAVVRPFQRFMHAETASAMVMLAAAVAALIWANSPWHEAQTTMWETYLSIELGHLAHIDLTLVEWVNDALMAIFFFVVGLEIKRELIHGELRDPRKAALPAIAALGGMLVPAGIFMVLNRGTDGFDGWGIPMATDIAFAVAVVALVGPRIPGPAKIFLLTLAIADDIGAIIVIAIFYTSDLSLGWLLIALLTLIATHLLKLAHVRALPAYFALAVFAWFAMHESGIHATLAGVALGLLTPAWAFYDPRHFRRDMATVLSTGSVEALARSSADGDDSDDFYDLETIRFGELERLVAESQSPLDRLESRLHLWVAFVIVPVFAFANAGVRLSGDALDGVLSNKVVLGIALGLIIGKTIGVFTFTLLAERVGVGRLPAGVDHRIVFGLSVCAGIGFTVALFVASLAFDPGSDHADSARIGILAGSTIAGVLGYFVLRSSATGPAEVGDVDDDEGSAAEPGPQPAFID